MTYNEKPFNHDQLRMMLTPEELHSLLSPEEQEVLGQRNVADASTRHEILEDSDKKVISQLRRQLAELTERVELLELRMSLYADSSVGSLKQGLPANRAESAAGKQSHSAETETLAQMSGETKTAGSNPQAGPLPSRLETYGSRKKKPR